MADIDLADLFKLRLVVGRFGEMDGMGWWNTKGVLGPHGEKALGRGLPRTHYFAQARIVFTVAQKRCNQVFSPPDGHSLWSLPAELERDFETQWHQWLDAEEEWTPFFQEIVTWDGDNLLDFLTELDLLTPGQSDQAHGLRRSAQGRGVLISDYDCLNNEAAAMLAAGFCRGEPNQVAVPYVRTGE